MIITATEAAKRLGITRIQLYKYIYSGRLPATKFGRDWQIKESDLARVKRPKIGRPPKDRKEKAAA